METSIYKLYFLSNYIELNNYKEPLIYYYQIFSNVFNGGSYTTNHLNFDSVKLITYNGIILDKSYNIYTYAFTTNEKLVVERDESNDFIFGSFYFWMQNSQQTYTRKYKMIQDICASIGGFIRIILTLASLFDFLFHHFSIYKDLNFDISHNYLSLSNKIIKKSSLISQKNVNLFENLFKRKILKNNYVNSNHNNLNSSYNFENSNGNFIVKKKLIKLIIYLNLKVIKVK
jgi:hypothetical protein